MRFLNITPIKDVYDNVTYLASLGKAQTAAVKRDAEIGVAQANRDAGIREAECEKAAMDVKYNTDTKIEDNSRAFKLQKAHFDKEVNTAVSCLQSWVVHSLQNFLSNFRKPRHNWLMNCKLPKFNKRFVMRRYRFR